MSGQSPGPGSLVFLGSLLLAPLTTCPDQKVATLWPHEAMSSGAFFFLLRL